MRLGFKAGSGTFQGRDLQVKARWARVVNLLHASDSAVLVHYSSDTLHAVVKDVLLGVPSFSFAFPQMGLVQFKQLGLYFLDFRS